ncbi:hypothetical protein BLNAU_8105 [Blattamonas nauphoetae]|uniref:Uncharacterized protein n=1 Tax=Blattamonas nauphoetae TaxID=2049346 RepID=A0ABQ9XZX8_9EUKA|nr:hypothetical protein BLNAU_8105 [Blattamonas nauphoetae]
MQKQCRRINPFHSFRHLESDQRIISPRQPKRVCVDTVKKGLGEYPLFHIFITAFVSFEEGTKRAKGFINCNGSFGGSIEAILPDESPYERDGLLAEFDKTDTQVRMSNMNDACTPTGRDWMPIPVCNSLKVMNKPQDHLGVPTHIFFSYGKMTTFANIIKEEVSE